MLIVKLASDGSIEEYPYTLYQLRIDNPDIMMRREPSAETLASLNAALVTQVDKPVAQEGSVVEEVQPELVNGTYHQVWLVRPMTEEELDALVPNQITMRQARLALLGAGLLTQVDAAIASMPSPQKEAALIEWEYGSTVERNSALIATLAPALGLTDAQVKELFKQANTL